MALTALQGALEANKGGVWFLPAAAEPSWKRNSRNWPQAWNSTFTGTG